MDPVDAVADAELRMLHEVGIASIGGRAITKESDPAVWAMLLNPSQRDVMIGQDDPRTDWDRDDV